MSVPAMTLREAMNPEPECLRAGDSVREAARRLRDLRLDSLPVCDDAGRLRAVLTEHDIVVRCVAEGYDPGATQIGSLLTRPPVAVRVQASLEDALGRMIEHAVRRIPVTEDGRLVGTISQVVLAALVPPASVRRLMFRTYDLGPGSG